MIKIPKMTRFTIPANARVETLKMEQPITTYCEKHLTRTAFHRHPTTDITLFGGFIKAEGYFSGESASKLVSDLNQRCGCQLSLGSPLDGLAYRISGSPHPEKWIALCRQFSYTDKDLLTCLIWSEVGSGSVFGLAGWKSIRKNDCEIFVVSETDPGLNS